MSHPLLDAIRPVADALGAVIVTPRAMQANDIPLTWEGDVVGGLRLPGPSADIGWFIAGVERELGAPLDELSREDKQRAVKLLNDRGAFGLRKSVEQVAEALGVSRFTVYNYLNRPEGGDTAPNGADRGSSVKPRRR